MSRSFYHCRAGVLNEPCQFETLDLSLQEEFEKFLQERGINESLAFFVPEYAQYKEQKVRLLLFYHLHALIADGARLGICRLAEQNQELHRRLTNSILLLSPQKLHHAYGRSIHGIMFCLSATPSIHVFSVPTLSWPLRWVIP